MPRKECHVMNLSHVFAGQSVGVTQRLAAARSGFASCLPRTNLLSISLSQYTVA
jgi:hypothetical protein